MLLIGMLASACQQAVEEEADEVFAAAESALQQERWSEADEAFYEVLLLDPKRVDAWIGRGMTLTELGETESARQHYEEALALCEGEPAGDGGEVAESFRKRLMLLVLLAREEEARALALAAEAAESEGDEPGDRWTRLIDAMNANFADMILPPAAAPEETVPVFEDSKAPWGANDEVPETAR